MSLFKCLSKSGAAAVERSGSHHCGIVALRAVPGLLNNNGGRGLCKKIGRNNDHKVKVSCRILVEAVRRHTGTASAFLRGSNKKLR